MLISKLLEQAHSAQDAVDRLLGLESGLEKKAKKENLIFVHAYVVHPHLRRRSFRKKSTLRILKGGKR